MNRLVAALALLAAIVMIRPPDIAGADGGSCAAIDPDTGVCLVEDGGEDQSQSLDGNDSGDVDVPNAKCYDGVDEIPCQTKDGYWHAGYGCYLKPYDGDPRDQDRYGYLGSMPPAPEEGMARLMCTSPIGGGIIFDIPEPEAEPPPDPRQIAWQLVAEANIRAGELSILPDNDHALIGMPTWMWVGDPGPRTTGPIVDSATTRGYTVSIEARLDKVVYDMGDGTTVTCAGADAAGTPYRESYKLKDSPTCGHTYTERGDYTITARSYWTIDWYGVGQAGTLTLDFTRTTVSEVREKHSVTR